MSTSRREKAIQNLKNKLPSYITFDESTYTRYDKPAKFIDEKYGEWRATPKNVSKGQRHKKRGYEERVMSNQLSVEEVKSRLPSHITLDESTYKSTHKKAKFIDADYGEFWTSFNEIDYCGRNHPQRARDNTIKAHTYTKEDILEKLPDNISLDFSTYINASTPATFFDKDYGKWETRLNDVLSGHGHPERGKKINAEKSMKTKIENGLVNILPNGKHVSEYCKEKNVKSISAANILYNQDPELAQEWIDNYEERISSLEIEFQNLYKKEGIELKRFSKKVTMNNGNYYRPDFKFSNENKTVYVDVDGLVFHSILYKKKKYHLDKRSDYHESGYKLLQFRQDEVRYKSQIVKSIIQSKLGLSSKKYMARKLKIKKVENKVAQQFLKYNHLMGEYKSAKYIGLYNEDGLVSLLGYKKTKNGVDVSRFCNKLGTSVTGGLSKLLKHVEKVEKPNFIQSFVDLRYGDGKSLEGLGFKLEGISLGWQWTDGYNTFDRLQCKANMDSRRLSEAEHAKELGWVKIYDAGQAKYIKDLVW